MDIMELLTFNILGLGLMFIEYMISKNRVIGIIHSYHYTKVEPKDKKMYCQFMGIGSIVTGIGCFWYLYLNYVLSSINAGTIILIIMMIFGVSCMIYSQLKYNKGIF